jgi:hypothetical protein
MFIYPPYLTTGGLSPNICKHLVNRLRPTPLPAPPIPWQFMRTLGGISTSPSVLAVVLTLTLLLAVSSNSESCTPVKLNRARLTMAPASRTPIYPIHIPTPTPMPIPVPRGRAPVHSLVHTFRFTIPVHQTMISVSGPPIQADGRNKLK